MATKKKVVAKKKNVVDIKKLLKKEKLRGLLYYTVSPEDVAKAAFKDAELKAENLTKYFLDYEAAERFQMPGEPYILGTNGELFRVSHEEMYDAKKRKYKPSGVTLELQLKDGVAVTFTAQKVKRGKNRWATDIKPIDKVYKKV